MNRYVDRQRTWPRLGVRTDTCEVPDVVLDVREERDVDEERDDREERGEEGDDRCDERRHDMVGEREEQREEGHASGYRARARLNRTGCDA